MPATAAAAAAFPPAGINPDFCPAALAPDALAALDRDGLWISPQPLLSATGVAFAESELLSMMGRLHGTVGHQEIVSPYQRPGGEWMWALATHPVVLDLVEAQVGPDILLWSGGPGCKAPLEQGVDLQENGAIPMHQDAPYWNVHPKRHAAGVWIAVSDVDAANGTMSVMPRAHKAGVLPRLVDKVLLEKNRSSGKPAFSDTIDPRALPILKQHGALPMRSYDLPAGSLGLHDSLAPHSALPNSSDRWRLVLVFRFVSAAGTFGMKEYTDCFTGERFPREYFLVRGEDTDSKGFRRSPWSDSATAGGQPGYVGEPAVDLGPHIAAEANTRCRLGLLDDARL